MNVCFCRLSIDNLLHDGSPMLPSSPVSSSASALTMQRSETLSTSPTFVTQSHPSHDIISKTKSLPNQCKPYLIFYPVTLVVLYW